MQNREPFAPDREMSAVGIAVRLLLGISILVGSATFGRAAEPLPRSVLMLSWSIQLSPWFSAVSSSFQSTLASDPSPITVYAEELDYIRFNSGNYNQLLSAFLREKYRDKPIGILLVNGEEALELAARLQSEVWPGIPIVLTAIDEDAPRRQRPQRTTGTTFRLTLHDSVRMARLLIPDIRRIVVVGDPLDIQPRHRRFKQEFMADPKGLELIDLSGRPMDEVTSFVSSLPGDAAIIYTPITIDGAGVNFRPADAFAAVVKAANRPILVDAENRIGAGAVGGAVLRPSLIGDEAARLVLRILGGEDAATIPLAPSKAVAPIFDWRELTRWNIDETNIPVGSEIRFYQPSIWQQYRGYILVASLALLVQSALIFWLLIERRARTLAQLEASRRRREVVHLNRTAAASVLSSSIIHQLAQPLVAILNNAQAAKNLIKSQKFDIGTIGEIIDDIYRADERASEIIRSLRTLIRKNETVDPKIIDLNRTIRAAVAIAEPAATSNGVTLKMALTDEKLTVKAVDIHLQQAILNIIMNAIEELQRLDSRQRIITVRARLTSGGSAEVTITDSGNGIPPDAFDRVFDAYFTSKEQGTGLGLPIARMLVERYGGALKVQNDSSGGASFNFELPLARAGV